MLINNISYQINKFVSRYFIDYLPDSVVEDFLAAGKLTSLPARNQAHNGMVLAEHRVLMLC